MNSRNSIRILIEFAEENQELFEEFCSLENNDPEVILGRSLRDLNRDYLSSCGCNHWEGHGHERWYLTDNALLNLGINIAVIRYKRVGLGTSKLYYNKEDRRLYSDCQKLTDFFNELSEINPTYQCIMISNHNKRR